MEKVGEAGSAGIGSNRLTSIEVLIGQLAQFTDFGPMPQEIAAVPGLRFAWF